MSPVVGVARAASPRPRRVARTGAPAPPPPRRPYWSAAPGRRSPRTPFPRPKSEVAPDISVASSDLGRRKAPGTVSMTPVWHWRWVVVRTPPLSGGRPRWSAAPGRPCRVVAPPQPPLPRPESEVAPDISSASSDSGRGNPRRVGRCCAARPGRSAWRAWCSYLGRLAGVFGGVYARTAPFFGRIGLK